MSHGVGQVAGAAAAVLALVRLGVPGVAAAVLLAVIAAGVLCWVLASAERSERAAALIAAARGKTIRPRPPASAAGRGPGRDRLGSGPGERAGGTVARG